MKVTTTMNSAAKLFPELAKRHASLASRAINAAVSEARKAAIKQAAVDLRLPQRILDRRLTRSVASKTARSWISRRASPWSLNATLTVYVRGIPFFQIAGAQTKRGVRGRGGRNEAGAFKVRSGKYAGVVFKRIRPRSEGSGRAQLEVPRVSVERTLRKRFDENMVGVAGLERFRRNYTKLLAREAARYGVRA